jgi:hypothetical protein
VARSYRSCRTPCQIISPSFLLEKGSREAKRSHELAPHGRTLRLARPRLMFCMADRGRGHGSEKPHGLAEREPYDQPHYDDDRQIMPCASCDHGTSI